MVYLWGVVREDGERGVMEGGEEGGRGGKGTHIQRDLNLKVRRQGWRIRGVLEMRGGSWLR